MGMLLAVIVHPANVQDRDGAEPLLRQARRLFPFVERIIGDAGYQGPKMAAAVARTGTWTIEIVRRCDAFNQRTGKPASIRTIIANMLADAFEFGLVPGDGDKFGANHNDLREVAFFLEEQYGVRFTRRGPDPARGQYTHATPAVTHA